MYHFILCRYTNQELSNYTHFQLSQIPELEFVYDRTRQDVEYVIELTRKYQKGTITDEEKEIWMGGIKGSLNAGDLNRNEFNISFISTMISVEVEERPDTWTAKDIPHAEDYERIRNNVQKIRDGWVQLPGMPPVPQRPLNTFDKWNDIEKILHDIYHLYMRIQSSYYQCGEGLYAGEEVGEL